MRAELLAVGTEFLIGESVDTNSAWLSRRLTEIGVDILRHTTVADDRGPLVAALRGAVAGSDIAIVTGGLGPTQDDLTRFAVAELAGVPLERRDELAAGVRRRFARAGRPIADRNLVQADLPRGAVAIEPAGSAPGFWLDVDGCMLVCLPGVPREMQAMAERAVIPELQCRGGLAVTVSRVVRTAGMSESAVADRCAGVAERLAISGNPAIAFLASRAETRVRVTATAPTRPEALALIDPVVDELVALLGAGAVGVDDEGVEHAIARQLGRLGWTLAVAESVTGGGVGARLVRVAGASAWFRGGLITYATDAKASLAGVDAGLLVERGPVNEAVAGELAEQARRRVEADCGLGVVGVAGPATQGGQSPGTICVGVALLGDGPRTKTVRYPGRPRQDVQEFAASVALDFLRRRLAAVADREAAVAERAPN